jgi:hypothetical protein
MIVKQTNEFTVQIDDWIVNRKVGGLEIVGPARGPLRLLRTQFNAVLVCDASDLKDEEGGAE